jgi:hypothetical protein
MAAAEIVAGQELEKNGMKVIKLDPQVGSQYLKIAYDAHWDELSKAIPDNAKKLRQLTSK